MKLANCPTIATPAGPIIIAITLTDIKLLANRNIVDSPDNKVVLNSFITT